MKRPYQRSWTDNTGKAHKAWMVEFVDAAGERRRKQFRTRREADAFWEDLLKKALPPSKQAEGMTIADAADLWLKACERGRDGNDPVEKSTLRRYRIHVKRHINPRIGGKSLALFDALAASDFRDDIVGDLSKPLAKKVLVSLKSILNEAVRKSFITHNPAATVKIKISSRQKEKIMVPPVSEVRRILAAAVEISRRTKMPQQAQAWQRYLPLVWVFVLTGMRWSEVLGLSWQQIKFDEKIIKVTRRLDEMGKIGAPKSMAGRRDIPISTALVEMLLGWKAHCPKSELDLVFPNGEGKPESYSNVRSRCWLPLMEAADLLIRGKRGKRGKWIEKPLPKYAFHPLRHFKTSILIDEGATLLEVMAEMGHASAQMTLETYGHLFQERDDRLKRAERVARLESRILERFPVWLNRKGFRVG